MAKDNLRKFIDEFNKLPKFTIKKKSFFEVSGYPHYENVCSNIFSFFFEVSEQHGMNDLFLKSLVTLIPEDCGFETEYTSTSVSREYKKIDILIETDSHYIIIENKIFAILHNDLTKYLSVVKRKRKNENNEHKEIIPIVLTLKCELDDIEMEKISKSNYIHITYQDFFDNVKAYFGEYLEDADGEWLIFLKHFINNVSTLRGDNRLSYNDYRETIMFFDNNYEIYRKLIQSREIAELVKTDERYFNLQSCIHEIAGYFKRELNEVLKFIENELGDKYNQDFDKSHSPKLIATCLYWKSSFGEKYDAFYIYRTLKGWELFIGLKKSHNEQDSCAWLREKGINYNKDESIIPEKKKFRPISLWVCKTEDNPNLTLREVAYEAIMLLSKLMQ
ncbi:MAG: PD-(D/E)XK nuclease family protein [Oscillospiraceae bacterium]|nr:PD-(D/E)XK nuclease family protein [Oscillospiraceae bacterium]